MLNKYNRVGGTQISDLSQSKQIITLVPLSWEDHGGLKGTDDMKQDTATSVTGSEAL